LQDLCGPKIRTGKLKNRQVELKEGEKITFTIDDLVGNENRVGNDIPGTSAGCQEGDTILLDDEVIFQSGCFKDKPQMWNV